MGFSASLAEGVLRRTLDNGLRVLVRQDPSAAVAAVVTWVRSGYFHEEEDQVGLSHMCEHLYFCGTPRRPGPDDIAREIKGLGGELNAGTYYDSTSYYVVLPSDRLGQALDLQADAFANPLFGEAILESEIGAVVEEAKRKLDNPAAVANEGLYARAFDVHRIRRWRIGTEEQIRGFRPQDLRRFWDAHYVPSNAVVAVVSDRPPEEVFAKVEEHFGSLPAGELQRAGSPAEPPRPKGLRHEVKPMDVGQATFALGFPTVPALHEDVVPLEMLAAVLADGRSSRFVKELRERRGLVTSVGAFSHEIEDVGLFQVSAVLKPERLPEFRRALFAELGRAWREAPTEEEMERARNRVEASFVLAGSTMLGQARTLASFEALGDYGLLAEQVAAFMSVTAEDVLRVARTYLDPELATLVEVVPADAMPEPVEEAALERELLEAAGERPPALDGAAGTSFEKAPAIVAATGEASDWSLEDLPRGATLLHRRNPGLPAVTLAGAISGGRCAEVEERAGVTKLMTSLLARGTKTRSNEEMAAAIESLGAGLGVMLQGSWWGLATTLLTRRFEQGAELLFDALLSPTFPEAEVAREREVQAQLIAAREDNPLGFASLLARRAAYGAEPPGLHELGSVESVASLDRAGLAAEHERWCRAGGLTVAVVGDLSLEAARDHVTALLDALPAGDGEALPSPAPFRAGREELAIRKKEQTSQVLLFPGPAADDDDAVVCEVLAACASGLGGRFFDEIRTKRGLAYIVACQAMAGRETGSVAAALATSPENEQEAREILLSEMERLHREPPEGAELSRAREYLIGTQAISLQSNGSQAGQMLSELAVGGSLTSLSDYAGKVRAVRSEDLARVAARYLDPSAYSAGVVRASR